MSVKILKLTKEQASQIDGFIENMEKSVSDGKHETNELIAKSFINIFEQLDRIEKLLENKVSEDKNDTASRNNAVRKQRKAASSRTARNPRKKHK